jgi:nitrogen fixation protein FixH
MSSYRWVPWAFAAALGVVVLVNGALAYFAVSSSTGLVTEHPYTEGTEYNRVLAAAAASDALGWHAALASPGGQTGKLAVSLTDRTGAPLAGLKVSAVIASPVEPLPDRVLPLAEIAPGRYQAPVALSRAGQWEIRIAAERGADVFQFAQRVVVK